MGASASKDDFGPPFPPEWLALPSAMPVAIEALGAISSFKPDDFNEVSVSVPELQDTAWELDGFRKYATAAAMTLPGLNTLVYKCVPKRMPETEFWRLFFCHAHDLVTSASTVSQQTVLAADDTTSGAIISVFDYDDVFLQFSHAEMEGIMQRDAEDDEKLAAGIRMAIEKQVASPHSEQTLPAWEPRTPN
ncbi:MAG: hypothetical protein SGPRY_014588 [Prymnesium sp.]